LLALSLASAREAWLFTLPTEWRYAFGSPRSLSIQIAQTAATVGYLRLTSGGRQLGTARAVQAGRWNYCAFAISARRTVVVHWTAYTPSGRELGTGTMRAEP
jgi:hypothetical protein